MSNLYRRGLKTHSGQAPIRETLAAAILMAAGYRADRPLLDPMCGAGTFALEAALIAKQMSTGIFSRLRFYALAGFPSAAMAIPQVPRSRADSYV